MPPVDLISPTQPTPAGRDAGTDAARRGGTEPSFADGASHGATSSGAVRSSWLSPCECPGDCLRDHQLD